MFIKHIFAFNQNIIRWNSWSFECSIGINGKDYTSPLYSF